MGKKYTAGITEKRLNNRRFRKTEEAILRVFFEDNIYIETKEMAAKAGVARSTFYHHHKAVREIVPDYKKYIMRKYVRMVNGVIKRKDADCRMLYGKIFIFMMQNQTIFEVLLKSDGSNIIREMIEKVDAELMKQMRLLGGARKIFAVYASEITELIYEWCRGGFDVCEINEVLNDVVYLTETVKKRLGPIVQ